MNLPHWQHFLSLEKDFVKTLEYVDLDQINELTFSIAYTKLLLAICSEVDVVAKIFCKNIYDLSKASKIDQYRKEITAAYPNFHTVETKIPRYSQTIHPWSSWSGNTNPAWWRNHNKVKHERDLNYQLANQKNVTEALTGLFCILLYVYQL